MPEITGDTGRGTSQIFSGKLEKNHRRSVGFICDKRRVQTRISFKTTLDRHKTNNSPIKKFRYFKRGSFYFVRKRCYRRSTSSRDSNRFLQYIFSGTEKKWKNETSHKSETPQPVSQENTFQNGYFSKSYQSSETKRLGIFSRFKRCISTRSDIPKSSQISKILHSGTVLSMESSLFRPNICSKSFHENCVSSSSLSKSSEHSASSISRRLAVCKSVKKSAVSRSREMPKSFDFTRFHDKQSEIKSSSNPKPDISRGNVSFQQGSCMPNHRENNKVKSGYPKNLQWSESGKRFSTFTRHNGILHRTDPKFASFHETDTTPSSSFLETVLSRSDYKNPIYSASKIPSQMVAKFSQHAERPLFSTKQNEHNHDNRCFENWVWRFYREPDFSGQLVKNGKQTSYKSVRNESGISDSEELHSAIKGSISIDSLRQHNSCPVYQQTGGHQITTALLYDMGSLESSNSKPNSVKGSSYNWQKQYSSRPIEQNQNSPHRMVFEQSSSSTNFSTLGTSFDRSICFDRESSNGDILFLDASPSSTSSGCFDNILGENVCIRISPDMSDPQDIAIYEAIPVSDNFDCTSMAQETLVHRSLTVVSSMSTETSCVPESPESTKNENLPSKSRGVQSNGMESIDRNFQTKGFSEQARNLLSASWRKGTQKDYGCKFDKFSGWCRSREIDPHSPTLNQIADFLSDLFEEGLQYRTIAGYRSMLSAILPTYDKFPVGKHPDIIRLLKGVFNSRPPKTKLLPEWNLPSVLKTLEKEPFEPLNLANLKDLTLKTVFLIAITTFRRCSDLQALRLGDSFMKIQEKGITFIRDGLAKQDRQNHYGTKIFVPAFTDNSLLDPRRCLLQYLEKTKSMRKTGNSKLFLALKEPHDPVSAQTISHWIVQLIKSANTETNLKVKAHSTRAIGSSWALFKGASMKSVLESADWSSESTFCRFYFRDLEATVLKH